MFRLKVAFRYAFSKVNRQRFTSVAIAAGIAVGIFAMFLIMSIMNAMQIKQMEILRAVESFDVSVSNTQLSEEELAQVFPDACVFAFAETPVLITDRSSARSSAARIRAYEDSYYEIPSVKRYFINTYGPEEAGLMLSYSLAGSLGYGPGHTVELTFLRPGKTATIVPYTREMDVQGYFHTSLAEFNSNTVVIDMASYKAVLGDRNTGFGIIGTESADRMASKLKALDPDAQVITWKEYNSEIYGALVLEKSMMYIFLSFIFLIVCVNLRNTTRRLINRKRKEGAMLRALGCRTADVKSIFILQGALILLIGEIAGSLLGLFAIRHFDRIFVFLADITRSPLFIQIMIAPVLSTTETAVILAGIFVLGLLFTYAGCRRVFRSDIMEAVNDISD